MAIRTVQVVGVIGLCFSIQVPTTAVACGGIFCAVVPPDTPSPPLPIDQNAERIVFEVDSALEQVKAHVQISYVGPADEFAWIVPVRGTPEVAESNGLIFDQLQAGSNPTFTLPPSEPCATPTFGGGEDSSSGCGPGSCEIQESCDPNVDPECSLAERTSVPSPSEDGVEVLSHNYTENYEYHVVAAEDTSVLVGWLNANGYNVSDNMTPVMDAYIGQDMNFLAVKLLDGASADDITPLSFTYRGSQPMIPIQLTAVAAQPLMGIQVFILSNDFFMPSNYVPMQRDPNQILFNGLGETNYYDWVARTVDESGGQLFVVEYMDLNPLYDVGYTPSDDDEPAASISSHRLLSRFYTRLSPHQMTVDPVFSRQPEARVVPRQVLLTSQPTLWRCGVPLAEREPSLCAFNYCGQDAQCTDVDGRVGCICPNGQVGQSFIGPDGGWSVTCVPADNPYGVTAEAAGVGTEFDPCVDDVCGMGTCVVRAGFPSCDCDLDAAACLEGRGVVRCFLVPDDAPRFGPGAGEESIATLTTFIPAPSQSGRGQKRVALVSVPLLIGMAGYANRRRARRCG